MQFALLGEHLIGQLCTVFLNRQRRLCLEQLGTQVTRSVAQRLGLPLMQLAQLDAFVGGQCTAMLQLPVHADQRIARCREALGIQYRERLAARNLLALLHEQARDGALLRGRYLQHPGVRNDVAAGLDFSRVLAAEEICDQACGKQRKED